MKRFILALALFALLIPASASATTIKRGNKAILPYDMYVVVKNSESISNETDEFAYNDSCYAESGSTLIAFGTVGQRVLVYYESRYKDEEGYACPSGARFFIAKKTFLKGMKEYQRIQKEKRLIKQLTK